MTSKANSERASYCCLSTISISPNRFCLQRFATKFLPLHKNEHAHQKEAHKPYGTQFEGILRKLSKLVAKRRCFRLIVRKTNGERKLCFVCKYIKGACNTAKSSCSLLSVNNIGNFFLLANILVFLGSKLKYFECN